MRQVLKAISSEVNDCPRLFTLTPQQATGLERVKVHQNRYQLVLWCEHPGHWHPWSAATYHLDQPKDWLMRISPVTATLVLELLKLVVPIAGAVAGVMMTEDQLKDAKHRD